MADEIVPSEGEALPTDFASAAETAAERGFVGKIENLLAILVSLGVVFEACDLYRAVGIVVYGEQFLATMMAIAHPLVFLRYSMKRSLHKGVAPWYDLLAAVAVFGCWIYVAILYPDMSVKVAQHPADGLVVAAILLVLMLEALRRTSGAALVWTVVFFLLLAVFGDHLPTVLSGRPIDVSTLTFFSIWDGTATLGNTLEIVVEVVVAYVLFGNILFRSGGSKFFTGISMALMGRYRGGPAKIAIVGSSLFGMISGSVVSNVATVGVVTIPLMKEGGYKPYYAAAIEACSSTGGQLMPPVMGIAAFIMAEYLEVPYREVAIAAIIPSLLYYGGLFIQCDLEAVRSGIKRIEESRIPRILTVIREGWFFPIPFAMLLAALFWFNWAPDSAAIAATGLILVVCFALPLNGKRLSIREFIEMLRVTGLSVLDLFLIGGTAGVMIGALNISGLGFGLSLSLVNLSGGDVVTLLILAAIVNVILGLGMPTVACYILLATLVAPALIHLHIQPMAAHMFIMYYGILSVITPPVAVAAYAAANMAGAEQWKTGWESMRFGWTAFVIPFGFVFSNTLLMKGSIFAIAVDFLFAMAGIWFVCAGMMAFGMRRLSIPWRLVYAAIGIGLFVPDEVVPGGRWVNIAAAAVGIALLGTEWALKRRTAAAAAAE